MNYADLCQVCGEYADHDHDDEPASVVSMRRDLEAAYQRGYLAGLEAAAKVADEGERKALRRGSSDGARTALDIASEIRRLKGGHE